MSELKGKCEMTLTPNRLKVINLITAGFIIFTNILRFFVKDDSEGINGTPLMLFVVQTVLTVTYAVFIVCGELFCPPILLANFPLLISRTGRGALIILISLPLMCAHFAIILLVVLTTLIGVLNVWLGWKDPPVTLKMASEGKPVEGSTSKEFTDVQAHQPTSSAPALTGTAPAQPPDMHMPEYNPNAGGAYVDNNAGYNAGGGYGGNDG